MEVSWAWRSAHHCTCSRTYKVSRLTRFGAAAGISEESIGDLPIVLNQVGQIEFDIGKLATPKTP
ncbi:hypothetical protein M758_8G000700 [Ceratodon purpureus]|nr:hypothetical protein M758_8G000700 [Ceratodon purpureus]